MVTHLVRLCVPFHNERRVEDWTVKRFYWQVFLPTIFSPNEKRTYNRGARNRFKSAAKSCFS